MRRFLLFLLAASLLLVVLSGCIGNFFKTYDYKVKTNIGEGEVLPPKSIVSFELLKDGKPISSLIKVYKDSQLDYEATKLALKHDFIAEDEGKYKVEVYDQDNELRKVLNFSVTALEREIYIDGGIIYYDKLSEEILSPATTLWLRFYKYTEKTLDDGTKSPERARLKLVDPDSDGIYDSWEELPAASSTEQGWIVIQNPLNMYNTTWEVSYIEYRENSIKVVYSGVSGDYKGYSLTSTISKVGFELNKRYARYVMNNDGSKHLYGQFMIHERYNSDNKPEFRVSVDKSSANPGQEVKVFVNAEHVADFAKLYDVRYMQFALKHSTMLVLDSVELPEFMDGLKETGTYLNNDNSVVIYKGYFDEEDETANATSTIAILTFKLSEDATGALSVNLVYEGWWDSYGNYPDLPNPIIKDKNNSNVDGFVFDHNPVIITVGGEE
ncbi:hypothetical protein SU69_06670 [Thermosipho melanesiensis]|uniref:Cohesin domain-containing protein n=2 Tax=Thermosipho melanesiensis TaxID=46541 RepID=A6LML5_THEM4|nr:hypothetical protein [Thermosipho melanesiensis]ABR31166.1 hypothetical protein Tmel_1317 [Thermosipho melanesiensis BI429]APT74896.1 hypothetical protein BW47_06995 [Thermosipho melanesiensis]OOC36195.1 hypothetical protein SU68_06740 [Thermosipho melanesiensis]OOC37013.1 hypothetical protein SU69_06670 [Thermosipho melanesiensis]OOC37765.1 hypothetical protein SU70_06680 [Thermosipho melanesiensis]